MKYSNTIKINFRGGIISPGDLYNILVATGKVGITQVSFGLRQQLLMQVNSEDYGELAEELSLLQVKFETDCDNHPNMVSSYPAEEVFITKTWLSEGVYKDIFDLVDYEPTLKINISDSKQSFTPLLTGNINWVASQHSQHFWHLFLRFPKTNTVTEWKQVAYTNDIAKISKQIEALILENKALFFDNPEVKGNILFEQLEKQSYNIKEAESPAELPAFNLPYYEGLNRYNDKYWLGIYRRDEQFSLQFLKDICQLCLQTKIGQLCSTPWKTIIVKGIEEKDRSYWNALLAKHQINVRHAANELNFQVEDNCCEGLKLKNFIVKHLSRTDMRTFGICIGIKTRKKSEVFSSILIRKKYLINIAGFRLFHFYDILCAHDFNPNERTGYIFSRNNTRQLLPEQLSRAIIAFYKHHSIRNRGLEIPMKKEAEKKIIEYVYQCSQCFTVYDPQLGELCSLCESPKTDFKKVEKNSLHSYS
jgi:hypothetical protein